MAYTKRKFTKEKHFPDEAKFGDNITQQNRQVLLLGSVTITEPGQLEAWLQSINSLESLLAGWWDEQYIKETNTLKTLPQKTNEERIILGHKTLAALMRLEKRNGFQGDKGGIGYMLPVDEDEKELDEKFKEGYIPLKENETETENTA